MKAFFIAHGFPPVQRSGSLRSQAFATYLPDHDVYPVVFTADPKAKNQAHNMESLIQDWKDDERWPEVLRVDWPHRIHDRLQDLLARLPFGSTYSRWCYRRRLLNSILDQARELFRRHEPQVIYASHAPCECIILADHLAREFGVPFVADLRDPWSHVPNTPYRHWIDFCFERSVERRTLARARRVIVPTRVSGEILVSECGVSQDCISLIPNGYDESDFAATAEPEAKDQNTFEIAYAGELTGRNNEQGAKLLVKKFLSRIGFFYDPMNYDHETRSLKFLLTAVEILIREDLKLREQLSIRVVGVNEEQRDATLGDFAYPQCLKLIPRVSSQEANRICNAADLLLLLQVRYTFRGHDMCPAIPAKAYSYLRANRRILSCLQPSEVSELMEKAGAGPVVGPDNPKEIAEALRDEIEAWRDGRTYSLSKKFNLKHFERRQLAKQLAEILHTVGNGN